MARTSIATDNFNRADGALGANWTQIGQFGGSDVVIFSNGFRANDSADCAAKWAGAGTFAADQYSSVLLRAMNFETGNRGAIARANDSGGTRDYYRYRVTDDAAGSPANRTTVLDKVVNGTVTVLDNTPANVSWANNDLCEIECEGTTIRGQQSAVTQHSATDSDIATGIPGIYAFGTTAFLGDNFDGGDITAAGGSKPKTLTMIGVG